MATMAGRGAEGRPSKTVTSRYSVGKFLEAAQADQSLMAFAKQGRGEYAGCGRKLLSSVCGSTWFGMKESGRKIEKRGGTPTQQRSLSVGKETY